MNFHAVDANNGNLVDMFGTFMVIGGVQYTPNQKAKAICKIADDNGVSHNVHIHQGNGELPTTSCLQQRHAFSISTFQGNYQNKPYTGYSGFWNNKAKVQQQAPSQPPQGPQQAAQVPQAPYNALHSPQSYGKGKKDPDWDAIAEGKVRHGLVCAYIQSNRQMDALALLKELEAWKTYIVTGHHPDNVPEPDESITEPPPQGYPQTNTGSGAVEDDLPF